MLCSVRSVSKPSSRSIARVPVPLRRDVLAKVKPGIVDDATLQRNAALCDKCKQHGAVFFQIPSSATDERLKLINVCTTCGHKWES